MGLILMEKINTLNLGLHMFGNEFTLLEDMKAISSLNADFERWIIEEAMLRRLEKEKAEKEDE